MINLVDINGGVFPGIAMGGIGIFSHISSMERQLNILLNEGEINAVVSTPSVLHYDFPEIFSIEFDLNDGKIFKLIGNRNYRGFFSETIGIGSRIQELLEKGYHLLFDDFDGVVYLKEHKGICFEVENLNYDVSALPLQIISRIIVYDPELDALSEPPEELFF